jgi:membrane-bound inhibitor of C-type lysozyme
MAAAGTPAADLQFVMPLPGDAERKTIVYDCEGVENPLTVRYINAAPNFLAILTVAGQELIFTSALSADGARYTAGPFEWWSRGNAAKFADLRGEKTDSVSCTEHNETP